MRGFHFTLIWLLFAFVNVKSQVLSADEAVTIITSTHPFDFGLWANTTGGPDYVAKLRPLYKSQLEAIQTIGELKIKNQVINLIPYLDYTSNASYILFGPQSFHATSHLIRKAWPTYSAILDLPDASASLKQYSLDKHNPLNYRLAALLVLRDLDNDTFTTVSHALDSELTDNQASVKLYLKHIEDRSVFFWGVQDLNQL